MREFLDSLIPVMGERVKEYELCLSRPPYKALRVNTLKISALSAEELFAFGEKSKLSDFGYYTDVKPSFDPFHHAGLYYMQEPSAQSAVSAFKEHIGERVLDLCAAPGGKCSQAAAYMNNGGVLFANEIDYKRALVLKENLTRLGVKNSVITCNSPDAYLAFSGYFDTVILDAPCSGEGMMRKKDVHWSEQLVSGCAARQEKLIKTAAELLSTGGKLLYSTCTFNMQENENIAKKIVELGFEPIKLNIEGSTDGIGFPEARRLFPYDVKGEGHFACAFVKTAKSQNNNLSAQKFTSEKTSAELKEMGITEKTVKRYKNLCFFTDMTIPDLSSLNVLGIGVSADPYAVALSLTKDEAARFNSTELGENATDYLRGKEIPLTDNLSGEVAVTYKGYPLGTAKAARTSTGDRALKNRYPKNLRIRSV